MLDLIIFAIITLTIMFLVLRHEIKKEMERENVKFDLKMFKYKEDK